MSRSLWRQTGIYAFNISLHTTVGLGTTVLHNPATTYKYFAWATDCWKILLFTYKPFTYGIVMCSVQVCSPTPGLPSWRTKAGQPLKKQEVKTKAKEKTNQFDSPPIPGCPKAHSSLLLEPWLSSLLRKTWTAADSPSQVPAGNVETFYVDYPLQLINTRQWLLLLGWFRPAWESLHLWQAWDMDRDMRVGFRHL